MRAIPTRLFLVALGATLTVLACTPTGESKLSQSRNRYEVGQVWKYRTRPGEEGSMLVIGRITDMPTGPAYGIYVTGLKLKNSHLPAGYQPILPHAPISGAALDVSVTERIDTSIVLEDFDDAYGEWKAAKGGIFTISVAEIIETIEQAAAQAREQ